MSRFEATVRQSNPIACDSRRFLAAADRCLCRRRDCLQQLAARYALKEPRTVVMYVLRVIRVLAFAMATLVAATAMACGPTTALPPDAVRFDPPKVYDRWWSMIKSCSGRSGDLASVNWYRVPGSGLKSSGESIAGLWHSKGNVIVLSDDVLEVGSVVRHEMLHALLRTGSHPVDSFLYSCAGFLVCPTCGPWHPPKGYLVLGADSLIVKSHAELLPREVDGQRWVSLEVSVENPRGQAVVVAAPGNPTNPFTFSFEVMGPLGGFSSGAVSTDSSTLYLEPFGIKRWLYEFRVAADLTAHHIPVGRHVIRGGYARVWSVPDTVIVIP